MAGWRPLLPFTGALGLLAAAEWYLYAPAQWPGAAGVGLAGLAALLTPLFSRGSGAPRGWSAVRLRSGVHAGVLTVAVIAILVLVNVVADRHPVRFDATAGGRHTLSDQTRQVLDGLEREVTLRAFVRSGSRQGRRLTQLLEQYAYRSDRITVKPAVDPEKRPGLARRHEVERFNTVLVRSGDRTRKVPPGELFRLARFGGGPQQFRGEQALTRALLRLNGEDRGTLYFVTGHGEVGSGRAPAHLTDALEGEGYRVADLNLARGGDGGKGGVPEDATAVILAGPGQDYAAPELERLGAYLADGGRLLALVGPRLTADSRLAGWLAERGIRPREGVVVDPERHYFTDRLSPIPRYRAHAITEDLQESERAMVIPDARPLALAEEGNGPRPQALLATGEAAWAEARPGERPLEQGEDESSGPLVVAAARGGGKGVGGVSTEPGEAFTGRLLVVGSSALLGRELLGFQGNLDFFLNAANWLAGAEEQITIRPQPAGERRVRLSGDSAWFISFTTVVALPMLVLLGGIYRWWRRRNL